jgi:hypothetical protein
VVLGDYVLHKTCVIIEGHTLSYYDYNATNLISTKYIPLDNCLSFNFFVHSIFFKYKLSFRSKTKFHCHAEQAIIKFQS